MARKATFTVALSGVSSLPVTVSYTTQNGTATGGVSLDTLGVDYVTKTGTLTFAPGELSKLIEVSVRNDILGNLAEAFRCVLSAPVNATFPSSSEFGECILPGGGGVVLNVLVSVAFVSLVPGPLAATILPISAVGNQYVDSSGAVVRLKGINWYGMDGASLTPNGLYNNISYKEILDQLVGLGFNVIRLPFSDDMVFSQVLLNSVSGPQYVGLNNEDLLGKTPLQGLTVIAQYCSQIGMRLVLDHHRISKDSIGPGYPQYGTDGWPTMNLGSDTFLYGGSVTPRLYNETTWQTMWTTLGTHCSTGVWASDPKMANVVIGFEPHNEPHNVSWAFWAGMCERLFPVVNAIRPNWMMFVDGAASTDGLGYWWGGDLKDVATRPLVLPTGKQNKLAYVPHEYAHSVFDQTWMSSNANTVGAPYPASVAKTVPNWPNNLEAKFDEYWGFIYRQGIAPIWLNEFGGGFGVDATTGAVDPNQTSAAFEIQWGHVLVKYMNGLRNDNTNMVPVGGKGVSFAYFALNPESGNPLGGLVMNKDYSTIQRIKMDIILPLLED